MGSNFGYDAAYDLGAEGVTVTSSGTSQSVAIPNARNGLRARVVRLQTTGNLHINVSVGAGTATDQSMMLSPNFDVLVNCMAVTHINYIERQTGAKLNITPLEC
jgi:hypothetical protein